MRKCLLLIALLVWAPTGYASNDINLDDYAGEVVLIDFWASWCVPCRRSFPWMNAMHSRYADDGLRIIAVNVDRNSNEAARFLEKYPADFEIVYDPKAELARAYDVQVMPSSVIIGRDGEVIGRHSGFKVKRQDEYESVLREALSLERK